jgi:hypothetical protein
LSRQINDPRRTKYGNIRHKLIDLIGIAFTAALCGYEDYEAMEGFGRLKRDFLKAFLELPNGIPDESAFRRVLQCLNPRELWEGLVDVKLRRKEEGAGARLVNRDGKTIRGSGFHVVSAWVGEHGLTLGQLKSEEKSNDIKAVPKLLEIVDMQGDVVTAEAMSCQKEIARKIREQGADYIRAVKENQPTLYGDIKEYFEGMEKGGKRERNGANRPIVHFERGFFHGGISEIHPQALVDREPAALDDGYRISGRGVPGEDGECGA